MPSGKIKRKVFLPACVLLLCGFIALPGQAAGTPQVEAVSFTAASDGNGLVVRIHTTGRVNIYHVPRKIEGNRLEFAIFNATLSDSYSKASPREPVRNYTVQRRKSNLVFRFRLRSGAGVSAEAYRDRESTDLLLSLSSEGRSVAAASGSGGSSASTGPDGGDKWDLYTVVLDAGHGGHDPGAQAYGLDEKDVVLDIARKVGSYIEEHMDGVDVIYTRKDDRFVPLRERGRIANRTGAKLFVSIHANAARDESVHGTETYFLGMHKTEAAERVMKRENSVIELEDNPDQYDDMRGGAIMQSLAQSAYMRQSEKLSGLIQQQFDERVNRKNRGVKQAGFLVLWAASMPAVLIETGFLTNAGDAAFLSSDRGQTYLASAIFRAVRDYKKQYERGLHARAPN